MLAHMLDAAAHINGHENQLGRKSAILTHELRSASRLTVVFSKIYCELKQIG
jgi:hypothetical protein